MKTNLKTFQTIWLPAFFLIAATTLLAQPKSERPTLFLIGDSTVKNGSGKGDSGLWGWGTVIGKYFDTNKIAVQNRAIGGRSSRTFWTEGRWEEVRTNLKAGDFVIMQFGHNDGGELAKGNRPRASLKGNSDESREVTVETTGKKETVHSFGWYLRTEISEAKAKGATPIVCSLIPRNIWRDGKVARASNDYGKWAAEAAKDGGALFIDLNEIVAKRYEELGQPFVATNLFTAADHTHTTRAGAETNAAAVVSGIKGLDKCPLKNFLAPEDLKEGEVKKKTAADSGK